jgi:hypothetical protein
MISKFSNFNIEEDLRYRRYNLRYLGGKDPEGHYRDTGCRYQCAGRVPAGRASARSRGGKPERLGLGPFGHHKSESVGIRRTVLLGLRVRTVASGSKSGPARPPRRSGPGPGSSIRKRPGPGGGPGVPQCHHWQRREWSPGRPGPHPQPGRGPPAPGPGAYRERPGAWARARRRRSLWPQPTIWNLALHDIIYNIIKSWYWL